MPAKRRSAAVLSFAFVLAVMSAKPAMAAPGDLDPTFGRGGKVVTNFGPSSDGIGDIAIQADGKIVAAGMATVSGGVRRFALARYKSGGALDASFGVNGKVITSFTDLGDEARALAIQTDGKIVAVGSAGDGTFAMVRYKPDGTRDDTFGHDGKVTTDFTSGGDDAGGVAIQTDGKIVAAGTADNGTSDSMIAVARYEADGTLDSTFGSGGKVTTRFSTGPDYGGAVAIQSDGKILVAGDAFIDGLRFALVRYKPDGTLDTTFSADGKVTADLTIGDDFAHGMAIQDDGKIVVAGDAGFCCEWTSDFGLVRFNPDGTLDQSFGDRGKVITQLTSSDDVAVDVDIQADGRIVAVGSAGYAGPDSDTRFAVARYDPSGTLDPMFSGDGVVSTNFTLGPEGASAVAIQVDGRIVAAGGATFGETDGRFALARYLSE